MKADQTLDFLLIRMDRIGDLVLTLPVDQRLTKAHKKSHWMISSGLGFILQSATPARSWTEVSPKFSWTNFFQMVKWLRDHRPKAAIVYFAPWWVSLALWLARVPRRVGRLSQWHSYLFFNRGLRQKRSLGDRHELEFNLELTGFALNSSPSEWPTHLVDKEFLRLSPSVKDDVLSCFGLKIKNFYVVHPGMGGSALNWPTDYYFELIKELSSDLPVVITGTHSDQSYLAPLKAKLESHSNIHWLDGKLSGPELLVILQHAKSVVAPSTGVAHLSASVGAPTVALFSPVRSEQATRWRPLGEKIAVLQPSVEIRDSYEASVMAKISVDEVRHAVRAIE